MTDGRIVEELKKGNKGVLRHLYDHLGMVTSFVTKNSGSEADAQDVFQESVIIFFNNASKPDFILTSKISTYLFAVCKRIWLKKIHETGRMETSLDELHTLLADESFEIELQEEDESDLARQALGILKEIGETCKRILTLFYFQNVPHEEIKDLLNYNSEQVVRQQKHRCLKRMREIIKQQTQEVQ